MRAFVVTTGVIFSLLTVVHVWRMLVERQLLTEPWYILITVLAACLASWALRLAWLSRKPRA